MTVSRAVVAIIGVLASIAVAGWSFRRWVYPRLPVVPGEPYGIGDVVDLAFWAGVVGGAAVALAAAVVLAAVPRLRRWKPILVLTIAGLTAVPLYGMVHALLL